MEPRKYKAKLHIATGQFSFIEYDVEDEGEKILKLNDALLKHYENKNK